MINKKILVTGVAGFIGFHMVRELSKDDSFEIVGLDNINSYYDESLKFDRLDRLGIKQCNIKYNAVINSNKYSNFRFIKLNLEDKDLIIELFKKKKFDYVINFAAQAGVRYSIENPYTYIDSNIVGFLSILEACRHFPVKHLLFASSSSVYGGNVKIPFSESDKVDSPVSLYAATKKANELMAHSYSYLYKIPVTGLRFFTVYGPWGRPDMAYFIFTKKILAGRAIDVYNNGKMKRDFTYIDDVVIAIRKLLGNIPNGKDNFFYRIFNIGNNTPVDLLDFIAILENKLSKRANKNLLPMQPGDVEVTYADTSLIDDLVGFKPQTHLEIGLSNFVDWYRDYYQV